MNVKNVKVNALKVKGSYRYVDICVYVSQSLRRDDLFAFQSNYDAPHRSVGLK